MAEKEIELNETDRIKVEDILIEILVCAIKAPKHIRPSLADMAIGLANLLDEKSVERCKEYAKYRAKEGTK